MKRHYFSSLLLKLAEQLDLLLFANLTICQSMTSLDAHRQGEPLLCEDRFRSAYLLSLNMKIQLHNEFNVL